MGVRVLLVDDHAVVRDGLTLILGREAGIEVVGATGLGREALQLAERLQADVVVMDLSLPDLNGVEATEALSRQYPHCRVVILSMHTTSEHVHRALRAGACGYVVKESAGTEVVEAVRAVHAGGRYVSVRIAEKATGAFARSCTSTGERSPLERLSRREREILPLVAAGISSAEIGTKLALSRKTVETYRSRMMRKLGVSDLAGLVRFAVAHGLVPPS